MRNESETEGMKQKERGETRVRKEREGERRERGETTVRQKEKE